MITAAAVAGLLALAAPTASPTPPTLTGPVSARTTTDPSASDYLSRLMAARKACTEAVTLADPRPVPEHLKDDCMTVGMYVAVRLDTGGGTWIDVPWGPTLVRACRADYRPESPLLAECLAQPQQAP